MNDDVVIVGAGPSGAVAATVLARAGARVRLLDRAQFPREKLCGDTVNPGTLAILRRLQMADRVDAEGLQVDGMIVTGMCGVSSVSIVSIRTAYPRGLYGRALSRAALDSALVDHAVKAGATFESGVHVTAPILAERLGKPSIAGVMAGSSPRPAAVTIAADGRRSTLAFGLGLVAHPPRRRRWAVGGYFEGVDGLSSFGEMHIRPGRYIGVAPVADGRTNVCLVKPSRAGDQTLRDPAESLRGALEADLHLAPRFRHAKLLAPPVVLGPLAVDAVSDPPDGLLLAGDAAGFLDPMTGDGLRFAVRGGELAAGAALDALARGWTGVHARLAERRHKEFIAKWRFNRTLRALVSSPLAIGIAAVGARCMPQLMTAVVRRAGDCDLA